MNYTLNGIDYMNRNNDIEAQKKINEMQLRFAKRDKMNKNDTKPGLGKITMTGCRDFDVVQMTYILCVGVYDITWMISFKDNNFWKATASESYDLPNDLEISEEQYVEELQRLDDLLNNKLITDEEYQNRLQQLKSLKRSTKDDIDEIVDEKAFEKFKNEILHATDHLTQDEYLSLSRFEQLEL